MAAKHYGRVSEAPRFPGENSQETPQIANYYGDSIRHTSTPPPDWKSFWRDFSEVWGGFARKFPEGGLDFLEVAWVWKFPRGILPKQTSKKFTSEPPKLLRSPSRSGSMQKLVGALSYNKLLHRKIFIMAGSFGWLE